MECDRHCTAHSVTNMFSGSIKRCRSFELRRALPLDFERATSWLHNCTAINFQPPSPQRANRRQYRSRIAAPGTKVFSKSLELRNVLSLSRCSAYLIFPRLSHMPTAYELMSTMICTSVCERRTGSLRGTEGHSSCSEHRCNLATGLSGTSYSVVRCKAHIASFTEVLAFDGAWNPHNVTMASTSKRWQVDCKFICLLPM